jgi:alpha-glucosidase
MNRMKHSRFYNIIFVFIIISNAHSQKQFSLTSPDKKINLVVDLSKERICYSIKMENIALLKNSNVSMTLKNQQFGIQNQLLKSDITAVNSVIPSPFYKKKSVENSYNQLNLQFKGAYQLQFRVFNSGVAYRFISSIKNEITVISEEANFNFATDGDAYVAYSNTKPTTPISEQFFNSFENWYEQKSLSQVNINRLILTPMLASAVGGKKVVITEANLFDYPGMFLRKDENGLALNGTFAACPKLQMQGGHDNIQFVIKERENYIAKTKGERSFPWRVIVISSNDKELADNDLVYCLADETKVSDLSWIKPGKVAWDWWNDWGISGVDFKTGVNNETYKHYIDFASRYGLEYVILDDGWAESGKADMMRVVPAIDLKMLVEYAKSKKVGLVLWGGYASIKKDMEGVCKHYSEMGIKGFKVDFMDRDDQEVVNFYDQLAETAAKYKLVIDFHGAFKPTGLQRTFPNVLNYEGVAGLEQMKWSKDADQMEYDVTLPFIRMVAGPMDYTQGAMRNASKKNYVPNYAEPMSMGTRCHQLALYMIFDSPFNMLCDSPTNYDKEQESTKFIAGIPTVWDKTVVLDGKVGEYIVTARQSGEDWYLGAITDWNSRDLTIDLSFLNSTDYRLDLFKDGANADRIATDYKHERLAFPVDKKLHISLAAGGGFAVKFSKIGKK